jgi:hypothetical protein
MGHKIWSSYSIWRIWSAHGDFFVAHRPCLVLGEKDEDCYGRLGMLILQDESTYDEER